MRFGETYENFGKFIGIFSIGVVIGILLGILYLHRAGTRVADLDRQQQLLTQELSELQSSVDRERKILDHIQTSIGTSEAGIEDATGRIRQIQAGYGDDIERLQQSARILEQVQQRPTKKD